MKQAFNYCCIVSKDTVEITVEQKRINNALMENRNAIIKLVTKAANGYALVVAVSFAVIFRPKKA